jgi:hypothetical protein
MNQKGEAVLFCVLVLTLLSGLLSLCGLELQRTFRQLENRTKIFLCVKETKGETNNFIKRMGQSNWMIKNTSKAQFFMAFIPGLQGASLKAKEIKKALQTYQQKLLVEYLGALAKIKLKACPIDHQLLKTPFETHLMSFKRGAEGEALARKTRWKYSFYLNPYLLTMDLDLNHWEKQNPIIYLKTKEKQAISQFPYSFH